MGLKRSIKTHRLRWLTLLAVIAIVAGVLLYFKQASAAFQGNGGDVSWGDTSLGRIRTSAFTYSTTTPFGSFGTSFRPTTAPQANAIQFVVSKSSPTRTEKLIGYQINDTTNSLGKLFFAKCTGTCNAIGNLTNNLLAGALNVAAVSTVTKVFDIAYEQQSGRAMVVYGSNGTTGKLYYCIYDGSSWGPQSNCAPTAGVNEISLSDGTTTLTGQPQWVRLVARGEQMPATRSNEILLGVQDSNNDIMTIRWDGTTWNATDRQVLTTTGGATVATSDSGNVNPPSFDVGWENVSGLEMAVYANGTALEYRTSTGAGFSSATNIATLATAAQWIRVASDTQSNRMSLIYAFGSTGTVGSTATATPRIWKTDGSTAGWTALTNLTMAQDAGQNISTVWEKAHITSGVVTPQAIFSASASANTQQPDWSSWTQGGGFVAWASLATTSGDTIVDNELTASPNNDVINMMQSDRDGRLRARTYSGSAWGALVTTNLSTTLINTLTGRTTNKTYIQKAFQYAQKPYAAWSTNWRIYDDETNSGNPAVALAPEGVTPQVAPSNKVRLRMAYAELGGNTEADVRKKLQFSSGAGCPDSNSCTWTDVDVLTTGSAVWRYADGGLTDNAAVASVTLTGATAVGYAVENGTAAATSETHNAGDIQEYDYALENNGAVVGTTYYFRGYDFGPSISGGTTGNLNPILREQILDTSGTEDTNCNNNGTASVCTYPSIQSFTSAPQAPIIYSPLNGDTGTAIAPFITVRTSDQQGDDVQYVVEWCPTNSWPCGGGGGSFDQTSSGTNWINKDGTASSSNSYKTSGVAESISSMGEYQVAPGTFLPSTTYYLRAKAIDPGGSATYSSYSSTTGFTTAATDVRIQGGTTINGGTIIQ